MSKSKKEPKTIRDQFSKRFEQIEEASGDAPVYRAQENGDDYRAQVHSRPGGSEAAEEYERLNRKYGSYDSAKQAGRVAKKSGVGGRRSIGGGMYQYPDGMIRNY